MDLNLVGIALTDLMGRKVYLTLYTGLDNGGTYVRFDETIHG
jgi:hypothetical protein